MELTLCKAADTFSCELVYQDFSYNLAITKQSTRGSFLELAPSGAVIPKNDLLSF